MYFPAPSFSRLLGATSRPQPCTSIIRKATEGKTELRAKRMFVLRMPGRLMAVMSTLFAPTMRSGSSWHWPTEGEISCRKVPAGCIKEYSKSHFLNGHRMIRICLCCCSQWEKFRVFYSFLHGGRNHHRSIDSLWLTPEWTECTF